MTTVEGTSSAVGDADDAAAFTAAKIFSATKMKDREALGDKITAWIQEHRDFVVVDTIVTLSSDARFHCLTITIFYRHASGNR